VTTLQVSLHATDRPFARPPRLGTSSFRFDAGISPHAGNQLPGTLASPRTGLTPAGCPELIARLHHDLQSFIASELLDTQAIQKVKDKVKAKTYRSTRHQDLETLIRSLNRSLRGWANYFRHGVPKAVFSAVDQHAWRRLMRWIRAKYAGRHPLGMAQLRRRFRDTGWRFAHNGVTFTGAASVPVTRYRYRGSKIPTPWTPQPATTTTSS
jgi:Group II intron, maturase-specific domain